MYGYLILLWSFPYMVATIIIWIKHIELLGIIVSYSLDAFHEKELWPKRHYICFKPFKWLDEWSIILHKFKIRFITSLVFFVLNHLLYCKQNSNFKMARTRIWKWIMNSLKCLSEEDVESMMCFVLSCKRHVDFIKFAKP